LRVTDVLKCECQRAPWLILVIGLNFYGSICEFVGQSQADQVYPCNALKIIYSFQLYGIHSFCAWW